LPRRSTKLSLPPAVSLRTWCLQITEGRERAKARGVKLGRKPKLIEHQKREAIRLRDRLGEQVREIARSYNVSHSTISRLAVFSK